MSQRLIPKKDGSGRIAVFEVLKSTVRTRDYVERGETEGKTLLDAMRDGDIEGAAVNAESRESNQVVELSTAQSSERERPARQSIFRRGRRSA